MTFSGHLGKRNRVISLVCIVLLFDTVLDLSIFGCNAQKQGPIFIRIHINYIFFRKNLHLLS